MRRVDVVRGVGLVVFHGQAAALEQLTPAVRDFKAAMRIEELIFADVTEPDLSFVEEPVA